MTTPSMSSAPISRKIAASVFSWRNDSSTRGASLSWQYWRAVSRTMRSSALSWRSSRKGSAQSKRVSFLAMRAEDDDTILEMSEKHRSQKPLTVEDVEESGFYFFEKPHEMLI